MAQQIKPVFTPEFKKRYKRLSSAIQRKFAKQLKLLLGNYRHPSLRAKKMAGVNRFEARIDRNYRFTFEIENGEIVLRTIGPHDEGLGKK